MLTPPPTQTYSQAKHNSIHPMLKMLMGGDLTAQWRCELLTAAVWRTKTERRAAKWRRVFGITAAGCDTEGNTEIASGAL